MGLEHRDLRNPTIIEGIPIIKSENLSLEIEKIVVGSESSI